MNFFVLIDQNLRGPGSHNETTALAFLEGDPSAVVIANCFCHLEHKRIEKLITYGYYKDVPFPGEGAFWVRIFGTVRAIVKNNIHLWIRLRKRLKTLKQSVLLWRDGDPRNAYAALWFAFWNRKRLKIVLYFHNQPSRYLILPFACVVRLFRINNIRCAYEDPQLSQIFHKTTGLRCDCLEFPIPNRPIHARTPGPVHIGVLGTARKEKGISTVHELLKLLETNKELPYFHFSIQITGSFDAEEVAIVNGLKKISARNPSITLIDSPLSEEAYTDLLCSLDVLLLPYQKGAYALRNSGVAEEGFRCGKILLMTEGTLVGDEMNEKAVCFLHKEGNVRILNEQLLEIQRLVDSLRARAGELALEFQSRQKTVQDELISFFQTPSDSI